MSESEPIPISNVLDESEIINPIKQTQAQETEPQDEPKDKQDINSDVLNQALEELKQNEEEKEEKEKEEEKQLFENEQNDTTNIILQLGDIIKINSPENQIFDERTFLIDYIDRTKIVIIDSDNFSKHTIQTDEDGNILDNTINIITIISSNPNKGYARQNGLLPDTWINIYFKLKVPLILTGTIINLEDDMIQVKIINDFMKNQTLYINFNYQGIPENLKISYFQIIDPIIENEYISQKIIKERQPELAQEQPRINIVPEPGTNKMRFDLDDIIIGDVVEVEEIVNLDKNLRKYDIEEQTKDLFDDLISTIPNNRRTSTIINQFNIFVKRFVELRQMSSIFDKYGNVEGPIIHSASDIPLADYLSTFENKLYWIKYGSVLNKKIFNDESFMREVRETLNIFINHKSEKGLENYIKFYNTLMNKSSPLEQTDINDIPDIFSTNGGLIISREVKDNISVFDNSDINFNSNVRVNGRNKTKKFYLQQLNTGLTYLNAPMTKASRMIGKIEKLTPNDTININSIITLPEPVVRFSRINLPNTNLLIKSNLNMIFFNYWELLNNKTQYENISIDDLNYDKLVEEDKYLKNIINHYLNLSEFEKPPDVTDLDIFKKFIKIITPKTSILFNLVKKYINGTLSPQNAISYLEPFMIYSNNLTFKQYESISRFVYEKIKEYNSNFSKYENIFNIIRSKFQENMYTNNLFNLLSDLTPKEIELQPETVIDKSKEWVQYYSEKNKKYYWYNQNTKESSWEKPIEIESYKTESVLKKTLLNDNITKKTFELYELTNLKIPKSEFFKQIILKDNGALFNSLIAYSNIKLMIPENLNSLFSKNNEELKNNIKNDIENNTCKSYIIAKKYYSLTKIINDNGKDIYFDKQFDKTNYDIIEEKFKKEQNTMSKEDFKKFLIPELKKIYNLNSENAEYLAETLTNGIKRVLEGHYAVLITGELHSQTMTYYIRTTDNNWSETTEISGEDFISDDDILCNLNPECLYDANSELKCTSDTMNKDTLLKKQLEQMINQFDEKYNMSISDLKKHIEETIIFYENKFKVLDKYNKNNLLKYNNHYYELGKQIQDSDLNKVVSPYIKLRDLILSQKDFSKKQQTIILFANKYCYQGINTNINPNTNEFENEWLMYCNETNTPLLPYFRYILAKTFSESPHEYDNVMSSLIKQIGKQSDDGGSWVDVNSGEVICDIDLDYSEGFKDGFVNKSRDIIEKDVEETISENMVKNPKLKLPLDKNIEYIRKVITALESQIGVNLNQSREFIERIAYNVINNSSGKPEQYILSETKYDEMMETVMKNSKTKIKKIPYSLYYSGKILYLAIALFAISLQTSIPSINTRKVVQGCNKSFQGYPMGDNTDNSFIQYLVCSCRNLSSDEIPWKAIVKQEDIMINKIRDAYDSNLSDDVEIKYKILKKIEYIQLKEKSIPDEHSIIRWTTFLPPLRPVNIKSANSINLISTFYDDLMNDIKFGNNRQSDKINTLKTKIIYQSLAIQESIQKIINTKELIMKSNVYHLDNACCNELDEKDLSPLKYFSKTNPEIDSYNFQIKQMSSYLRYLTYLSNGSLIGSAINTKRIFPQIPNIFNEETIYRGFITFCKFNTTGALSKELLEICISKPSNIGKGKTIQEQIFQLKKDGRVYDQKDLINLYQIVSRNNIILKNEYYSENPIEKIFNFLDTYIKNTQKSENVNPVLSENFISSYMELIESNNFYDLFERESKDMINIKNILGRHNETYTNNIIEFIKKNKASSNNIRKISSFLNNLNYLEWDFSKSEKRQNLSNDKLNNYIKYISNYIELLSTTFPNAIIKYKQIKTIPPKYWKLSENHNNMIEEATDKYYSPLNPFYGNVDLIGILKFVKKITKNIVKLSKLTPCTNDIDNNRQIFKKYIDEEMCHLMYQYYILCVFMSYINIFKKYVEANSDDTSIEMNLGKTLSDLFIVYITMMDNTKKLVNISYESISDKMFDLKELEKYIFTDRLNKSTQEERDVDNIFKSLKLGMYSLGESKALREYDIDQFEKDKQLASMMEQYRKKTKNNNLDDADINDIEYENEMNNEENIEKAWQFTEDYNDGDPDGDERDEYDYEYD